MYPNAPPVQKLSIPLIVDDLCFPYHINGLYFGTTKDGVRELYLASQTIRETQVGSRLMTFAANRSQLGRNFFILSSKSSKLGEGVAGMFFPADIGLAQKGLFVQIATDQGTTASTLAHEIAHSMDRYPPFKMFFENNKFVTN